MSDQDDRLEAARDAALEEEDERHTAALRALLDPAPADVRRDAYRDALTGALVAAATSGVDIVDAIARALPAGVQDPFGLRLNLRIPQAPQRGRQGDA